MEKPKKKKGKRSANAVNLRNKMKRKGTKGSYKNKFYKYLDKIVFSSR